MIVCSCCQPNCDRAHDPDDTQVFVESEGTCPCGGDLWPAGVLHTPTEVTTWLRCKACGAESKRTAKVE